MSRTKHLTQREFDENTRPTRKRAPTRLTKRKPGEWYFANSDRPKNAGNNWGPGFSRGQRSRKRQRDDKILGRRLERRRLNRSLVP